MICLDEPTSALDPVLAGQVASYVQDLAKENRIVLLTTHDMGLLERLGCHLFFMKDGCIIEKTTTKAFKADPDAFVYIGSYLSS